MWRWLAVTGLATLAWGQQAISTRAGLVQRVEGRAQVSDVGPEGLPTNTFVHLEPGQRMRTLRGRAEVVLAPGVYARFNAFSEIELVSAGFSDIRVRLIEGALLADLWEGKPGRDYNVMLLYGDVEIHPEKRGEYELVARPAAPAELRVHDGKASVRLGRRTIRVSDAAELPLEKAGWGAERELTIDDSLRFRLIDWSRRRRAELATSRKEAPLWTDGPDLKDGSLPPSAPTGAPLP